MLYLITILLSTFANLRNGKLTIRITSTLNNKQYFQYCPRRFRRRRNYNIEKDKKDMLEQKIRE